ncbi:hypothetical protein D9M68_671220 [compost metagenome]
MLRHHVLEHIGQPHTLQRRANHQADIAEGQRAVHIYLQLHAAALELPAVQVAAGEAVADAGQAVEVLGFLRLRMVLEKGRRRDHHRAQIGADGQGHHVGLQPLAEAHAGIEAGRHNIHQRVIGGDLDGDVGVGLEETLDQGQQHQLRRRTPGVDAQGARRRVAELIEVLQRVVDIAEGRFDPRMESFAGFGQGHATGGAVEQAHPQALFQGAKRMAQGGRG